MLWFHFFSSRFRDVPAGHSLGSAGILSLVLLGFALMGFLLIRCWPAGLIFICHFYFCSYFQFLSFCFIFWKMPQLPFLRILLQFNLLAVGPSVFFLENSASLFSLKDKLAGGSLISHVHWTIWILTRSSRNREKQQVFRCPHPMISVLINILLPFVLFNCHSNICNLFFLRISLEIQN